jgi:hypothetical protein|tara:strand:- start:169 stop:558 length:390 start_codon:yes stop_codon:yes gene_type:complete
MATKKITFDPDASSSPEANFNILGGANFEGNFEVVGTNNSAFDLSGYSGSAAMSKSVSVGATLGITTAFTVGFTSATDGKLKISLSSGVTRSLNEGRYVYDVLIVSSASTTYSLVRGNVLVIPPVAAAP